MIEGSTNDGEPLVQVSAQVMTRDDSSGGWVLMGGGGLSRVRLCKLYPFDMAAVSVEGTNSSSSSNCDGDEPGPPPQPPPAPHPAIHGQQQPQHPQLQHQQQSERSSPDGSKDNNNVNSMATLYHPHHQHPHPLHHHHHHHHRSSPPSTPRSKPEYIILGQRNVDNAVILNCRLKKDIQYTKVNPKFHHWKTDEKKFGLSFERSEDAESFDQAIRLAVADLNRGFHNEVVVDREEGIFSYMELPLVRKDSSSHSASTTSTTTSSPGTNSPQSPYNSNNNNNNDPFNFAAQQQHQLLHQKQQQHSPASLIHKHPHLHQIYYSSSSPSSSSSSSSSQKHQRTTTSPPLRNVHTNGCGSIMSHRHPHHDQPHSSHRHAILQHQQQRQQHQQQQQQHHHQQIHQQQPRHHHLHHKPQQQQFQLQQQQNQQFIQPSNFPSSPIISEKSSENKSSFDSSSGHEEIWVRSSSCYGPSSSISGKSDQGLLDYEVALDSEHRDCYKEESYVIFNKNKVGAPHEYSYPNLEPAQKPPTQRSITTKTKQALPSSTTAYQHPYHPHHVITTTLSQSNPPLPIKNKAKSKSMGVSTSSTTSGILSGSSGVGGIETDLSSISNSGPPGARSRLVSSQAQCKHCREVFSLDDNLRGSCEDAPDSVVRCMECVSCVTCATCLMYHCLADADGEYRHPCSCAPGDPNQCKRWTALSLLSLLFPCLWCYPPLKACHYCGTQCGLCGGRHKAA